MKNLILLFFIILTVNVLHAQNELWGTCSQGGQYQHGIIFKTDANGDNYTILHHFDSINGKNPSNTLLHGLDGNFYGLTEFGGISNSGTLFQYNPTTNQLTKKIDFGGLNGETPVSLIMSLSGKYYGLTVTGGINGLGTLFEYDPVTNIFVKKIDFDGISKGSYPICDLTVAPDGMIYGTTVWGGNTDEGTLFKYDPTANTFIKKIDFGSATSGRRPEGKLLLASNGQMYGLTRQGGVNDEGTLFEIDLLTFSYSTKVNFDGASKGRQPTGGLMQAANGQIYGFTKQGGAIDFGVMFQFDPSSNTYTKKIDFSGANGGYPHHSLMQASNGLLYGMTQIGGSSAGLGAGVLFQYDPVTDSYAKKKDFNYTDGSLPSYRLVELTTTSTDLKKINHENHFTIFPNPTTGLFEFNLNSKNKVMVFNNLGEILVDEIYSAGKQKIDIKNYSAGVYFVTLQDLKGETNTVKIVKQ